MRLTKFLGRKCKVCMRILLLKSWVLGTNCPSFLPILCEILFVFAVDLFLLWMPFCFCRGFLLFLPLMSFCIFLLSFCFSPLFLQFSPMKSEKRGSFFGKSPSFFGKSPSFFGKSPSFFCFSRRCCEVIMPSNVPVKGKACPP